MESTTKIEENAWVFADFAAKVANMNEVVTPGRPTLLEARKRAEEATYVRKIEAPMLRDAA